ncbi:MAG: hypothetical protein GWP14_09765 [Actinobacteria bacterium]|nr:hypothetical protein [Actinomycetota bacterium]
MHYRTLGRTGLKVSVLGMGGGTAMGKCGAILANGTAKSPDGKAVKYYRNIPFYDVAAEGFARVMQEAAKLGVNFLDTAPSYGDSEAVFGHYLKHPDNRKKWLVSTKAGVCGSWGTGESLSKQEVFGQFENSLQRLQIDKIDLFLIHSIDQYGKGEQAVQRILEPGGLVDALRELRQAGKIGFFGASGQLPELIPAIKTDVFDVILTYNTYNLLLSDAADELFPLARKKNVGIILGGVYYQGLLTGNTDFFVRNRKFFYEDNDPASTHTQEIIARIERLMALVGGDARRLRQLAVRFAMSEPTISTIVLGMKSIQEVQENVEAANKGPLTAEELEELRKIMGAGPQVSWKDA